MNRAMIIGAIAVLAFAGLHALLTAESHAVTGHINSEDIRLGFCPTMEKYAQQIKEAKPGIELIRFGSASGALNALGNGRVDMALIGRVAKSSEIRADTQHMRLSSGYTLVSKERAYVEFRELGKMNIHTALSEDEAEGIIPHGTRIIYYKSLREAFENGSGEAVLISWDDYRDEYGLVVVMENGKKAESFRSPVIYYNEIGGKYISGLADVIA